MLEGGEVNQIAIQNEGRHSIFDRLLGFGRFGPNDRPDFFEDGLHIGWKASDIVINGFGGHLTRFQFGVTPNVADCALPTRRLRR